MSFARQRLIVQGAWRGKLCVCKKVPRRCDGRVLLYRGCVVIPSNNHMSGLLLLMLVCG